MMCFLPTLLCCFVLLQEWAAVQAKIREASLNGESLEEAQEDFVIEFEDADQGDGAGAAALEDSKQEASPSAFRRRQATIRQ